VGAGKVSPFTIKIEAPTHRPKANAKWPVTIVVTNRARKPAAGELTMRILVSGTAVGKVKNGPVCRFVGRWHEKRGHEITWPAAAIGSPIIFQAVVTVHGVARTATYSISVHA
jgi:hypothetical protein